MEDQPMCPCGKPLHYTDPQVRHTVEIMIADLGETVPIHTLSGGWRVPRHYIALHGLRAEALPRLADQYGWEFVGDGWTEP